MKKVKIFKSGFLIVAVLIAMVGATSAYFTDTEESIGNIFVAGELDLKVDHTLATYNGMICENDVWQTADCDVVGKNLILNGDFEEPLVTTVNGRELFATTTFGIIWNFVRRTNGAANNLEFHRSYNGWLSASGVQHVELGSEYAMRVSQNVTTIPGRTYKLSYVFAPRPESNANENNLKVLWGGVSVADECTLVGTTTISWFKKEILVLATTTSTEIAFVDMGTSNNLGIFLDDVSLLLIECSSSSLLGTACNKWEENNLTNEKFFNFQDVKPGDFGRDVISLHVYDNDAWVCLLIENSIDFENTHLSLEEEAGDNSSGIGELSESLNFFFWLDNDADGEYEPYLNEKPITEGDAKSFSVVALFDSTNDGWLKGTTTEYVALAWCDGFQSVSHETGEIKCDGSTVGNTQQTDSWSADLVFYTEQVRNNPNFACLSDLVP